MASIISELAVVLIADDTGFIRGTSNAAKSLETLALESEQYKAKMVENMGIAQGAFEMQTLKAQQATEKMAKTIDDNATFMGASAKKVGDIFGQMGKYSSLALGAIVVGSIDAASKFDAAMELIATQAHAPVSEIALLHDQVLNLAATVGIGPDQLAQGLYHIESAGFRGKTAMDMLTAAAHNSAVGMSNMEDSAQALVGTMAVGFKDVTNAADAGAYLNTIVGIGDMKMQQLSAAISTGVLPSFKEAGLGMKDFGAAIATLTDNVTPANAAATRLRMSIALLTAPSGTAYKALTAVGLGADEANKALANRQYLEKYGISISQLSDDLQKPDGLLVAVKDLNTHLSGLSNNERAGVINKAFGGGRTSGAIQTLLDEQDRLQSKYNMLGTSTSRADQAQKDWANTQATTKQQLHELGTAAEVFGIKLGEKLIPPLTKFITFLTSHQGALQAFFGIVVTGLTIMTAAFIAMGVAAMANPVGLVVFAIVLAIVALSIAIYMLVTHWKTVWKFIKDIALDVAHAVMVAWRETMRFFEGVGDWIMKSIVQPIVHFFQGLASGVMDAVRWLEGIPDWIMSHVLMPIAHVLEAIGHVFMVVFRAIQVATEWFTHYVLRPIAEVMWFLLIPVRLVLDLIVFAFKVAWGFISAALSDFWQGMKVIIHYIVEAWNWAVAAIKAYIDMWMGWLKAFWDWFVNVFWTNGLLPIWHALVDAWNWVYAQIKAGIDKIIVVFRAMWDFLVSVWHGVDSGFIQPLWAAIKQLVYTDLSAAWSVIQVGLKGLQTAWDTIWGAMKSTASGFWSVIKGIFDSIMGVIHDVEGAFHSFESALNNLNPGNIGKSLWGGVTGLFRESGGPVPGGRGQAIPAILHGGEYVLNADQVDAIKNSSVPPSIMGPSAGALAVATGGGGTQQIIVMVDGRQLFQIMVQQSQRNKRRNNSTFLT